MIEANKLPAEDPTRGSAAETQPIKSGAQNLLDAPKAQVITNRIPTEDTLRVSERNKLWGDIAKVEKLMKLVNG